jgi:hypothetical protein
MTKAATKKAVTKTASKASPAVLQEAPDYLKEVGHVRNEDNFDQSDIIVPRVKLLAALSKEVEMFDTARAGQFWHTGFDQPLGESVDFIICARKKKYLLVAPLEDGQGILARAEDFTTWDRTGKWEVKLKGRRQPVTWEISDTNVIKSGLDQWGTFDPDDENSPPAATLFYEYLIVLPNHLDWGPSVLSLTRSSIRRAKKGLNDKIKLHEGAGRPMQAVVFQASSFLDKNPDGQDFHNYTFTQNGFASRELFDQAVELKNLLKVYRVQDEETVAAEDGTNAKASNKKPGKDDEF